MSIEHDRKIQLAYEVFYPRYVSLVEETLGAAKTLFELMTLFNKKFPKSSSRPKRSRPEILSSGMVTCDTTAMLVAIWSQLVLKINQCVIAVEHREREIAIPHWCVGVPNTNILEGSPDLLAVSYDAQRSAMPDHQPEIFWLHWKDNGHGLQPLKLANRPELNTPHSGYMVFAMRSPGDIARIIIATSDPGKTRELLKLKIN